MAAGTGRTHAGEAGALLRKLFSVSPEDNSHLTLSQEG